MAKLGAKWVVSHNIIDYDTRHLPLGVLGWLMGGRGGRLFRFTRTRSIFLPTDTLILNVWYLVKTFKSFQEKGQ